VRLTKKQAVQNRGEILEAATRLFKTQGIDNVSVADLMNAAGFSHGGFYNHFESKAELAVEAIRYAFDQSFNELEARVVGNDEPSGALTNALLNYLAPEHRDEPSGGCPTGSLPIDVSRQPCEAQVAFADGLERYIDLISRFQSATGTSSRQNAIATLSTLVGAIILSRAVKRGRPELSDEILEAASPRIGRSPPVVAKERRRRSV
jgi:TetR/AcrR family transcriptional repressor of nem operon